MLLIQLPFPQASLPLDKYSHSQTNKFIIFFSENKEQVGKALVMGWKVIEDTISISINSRSHQTINNNAV